MGLGLGLAEKRTRTTYLTLTAAVFIRVLLVEEFLFLVFGCVIGCCFSRMRILVLAWG